eukprot:CAMPEP_0168534942 /NCGR_PEP_ID=MMETSP0405-20121227/18315_1 /TAXON_ID=498012 /ORGANISM="Trichosphaerium sp, Strain Am-I-7 wt" /LENGTH=60 /DNA_ID=CAMNT_0008561975 /DNA_START=671 /DNA_END=849 /DNA_ORIENTATION=-
MSEDELAAEAMKESHQRQKFAKEKGFEGTGLQGLSPHPAKKQKIEDPDVVEVVEIDPQWP